MTDLRDARFKRALDAAPDADAAPAEATRRAIHQAAAQALAPPAPRRWAWWPAPRQRMPWNAAFATLLLAGLVTVLWRAEEVPQEPGTAGDVSTLAAQPAPVPAPAAPPQAPAAQRPADAAAPPQPAHRAPPPAARRAPATRPQPAPQPASQPAPQPAPQPALAQPVSPAPLAAEAGRGPETAARAESRQESAADLARFRDAPAARQATAEASVAAPVATPGPATAAAPAWRQWTQLRIESEGRSLVVPRAHARRLGRLLEQLVPERTDGEPFPQTVALSIELNHQDELLGRLEVAGDRVRWSAPDASGARTATPDPARLRSLKAEARHLLR